MGRRGKGWNGEEIKDEVSFMNFLFFPSHAGEGRQQCVMRCRLAEGSPITLTSKRHAQPHQTDLNLIISLALTLDITCFLVHQSGDSIHLNSILHVLYRC